MSSNFDIYVSQITPECPVSGEAICGTANLSLPKEAAKQISATTTSLQSFRANMIARLTVKYEELTPDGTLNQVHAIDLLM